MSISQDSLTELCVPSAKNGPELLTLQGSLQTEHSWCLLILG